MCTESSRCVQQVEALVHIDEDLNSERRSHVSSQLQHEDGVCSVYFIDSHPYLMVVGYDPGVISPQAIRERLIANGHVHVALVGYM